MTTPSSKTQGRFVPSEELGTVREWHFGAVDDWDGRATALRVAAEAAAQPSAEEVLAQARQDAFDQGFAQAQSETTLAWQRRMDDYVTGEGRQAADRMDAALAQLQARLAAMEQYLAGEVLALACDIARQVVRRELRADTAPLAPVVQEALGMLVLDGRPATVRLHPSDLENIKAFTLLAQAAPGQAAIEWIADAALNPGDCTVAGGGATVDGRLERRWTRAVAALGLPPVPWNAQEASDAG